MAAFNKFNDFSEQLARGVHNFGSHTFKVALTNTAPLASNTILANITQIANGNGYTTGGAAVPNVGVSEISGTTTIDGDKVTWTATGAMGPFRYVVLYNDTATSPADALIGWWDYGSSLTLAAGESFEFKPSNADADGAILVVS
ncbi:MAG: hypothetical protein LT106_18620 [Burkholderiaceae bacterium]|nr:hypothetical protein [Burkholderiaceae bacterium]